MKNLYKFLLTLVIIVTIMFSMTPSASASEADAAVDGIEAVKESVVQVVIYYTDENGDKYILKRGSGFLISESTVLTNYELTYLSKKQIALAQKYLGMDGKDNSNKFSYQIGVIVYNDAIMSAQLNNYSSKDSGIGILNLDEPLNRNVAVLGDASSIEPMAPLYVIGYKNVRVMDEGRNQEYMTQSDIKVSEGGCVEIYSDECSKMIHTAEVKRGALGGPTVNAQGVVVGINITAKTESGNSESISIVSIKELLDACGITYIHASDVAPQTPEPAEQPVPIADKSYLDEYILNYSALNKEDYTEDSYRLFYEALTNARTVSADTEATQEEVNDAINRLNQAKENLVAVTHINWPVVILIIVIIIIFIISLTLFILKSMNIIFKKKEPEKFVTEDNLKMDTTNTINTINTVNPVNTMVEPAKMPANDETTVLGVNPVNDQGTVVLGVSGGLSKPAVIIRTMNGERVNINTFSFVIGKDVNTTSYCIKDNPSISRNHAKITFKGNKYFICDLGSTNFTYVNNQILSSDSEVELHDGDVIRLSNEEFIFKSM